MSARWPMFALSVLAIALGTWGCSTVSFWDRTRLDMGSHFIIIASPESVNEHCLKRMRLTGARLDDGREIKEGTRIAGCVDYKRPAKPTMFISKRYSNCARHEAAHLFKLGTTREVGEKYKCLTVTERGNAR